MSNSSGVYAWCKHNWPTIVVIALGALIQIFLVTRPFLFLLQNLVPDDAFFYFTVARNVVHGFGFTFDGLHPTNGFHPLWLLVMIAITKFTGASAVGDTTPIQVALYLSTLMNVASAFIVSRILTRFTTSRWIAAFGIVVWSLNPFFIYETLNGLETSLALLLFAAFVLLALRIEEDKAIGGYLLVGFTGSLMVLARLDMAFYVVAFLAWILMRFGLRGGWKKVALVGIGGIPFLLWWAWNVLTFHMLLTSASAVETLVSHVLVYQDNGSSWFQFFKGIIYNTQYIGDLFLRFTGMYSILWGMVGAAVALCVQGSIALPRRFRDISVPLALFGGFLMLFIADASVRWAYRSWYFVSVELFLAILVVMVGERMFPLLRYRRTAAAALLFITLFSFYVNWSKQLQPSKNGMKPQIQLLQTAQWMNAHLPPGTVVGTSSPGIQGFFSEMPIVDLNGWINNSSAEAMQKRQLWKYVQDEHIHYLWDYGPALSYRYKSFLGIDDPFARMTLVHEMTSDPRGLRFYKVQ